MGVTSVRPPAAWVVVDFDGTCTTADSTGLLPHIAEAHALAAPESRTSVFARFEAQYVSGVAEIMRSADGAAIAPDVAGLRAFVDELDQFSVSVARQLGETGCLSGIDDHRVASTLRDFGREGRAPTLRPGCAEALSALNGAGCRLGVLSVGWCPPLIDATLAPPLAACGAGLRLDAVWCNALSPDGRVIQRVSGGEAKRAKIAALRASAAADSRPEAAERIVYVGDSPTDLPALIEADVGILIGSSRSARQVLRHFGVPIRPLPSKITPRGDGEPALWEAPSWDAIAASLLGRTAGGSR